MSYHIIHAESSGNTADVLNSKIRPNVEKRGRSCKINKIVNIK